MFAGPIGTRRAIWQSWNYADGHSRLEYPIGTVLYQTPGWISNIRFSPQGDRIAFMDHPALWDNRGVVCVVDLAGHVQVLSGEYESEQGVAWPAGRKSGSLRLQKAPTSI